MVKWGKGGGHMSRSARKKSDWGMYHVMLRGINRERIFLDGEDPAKFMDLLLRGREKAGFGLYAWCLMPNHIHLLMKEGEEPLGQIFRRVGSPYVYWFNRKYERVGHLFQDRFKSETVEDDAGFLNVMRYIHCNPVRAGLCEKPEDYPWSSFARYFEEDSPVDASMVLGIIDREEFYRFHADASPEDRGMDIDDSDRPRLTDSGVLGILKGKYGCSGPEDLMRLTEAQQAEVIRTLRKSGGSIRQVSRLTGISFGIVRKYD